MRKIGVQIVSESSTSHIGHTEMYICTASNVVVTSSAGIHQHALLSERGSKRIKHRLVFRKTPEASVVVGWVYDR